MLTRGRLLAVAMAACALPGVAAGQEQVALVAWAERGAAQADADGAGAAAAEILRERLGAAPLGLDAAASVAATCADADCFAGLGMLAGASRVVAIGVGPAKVRVVVVAVTPETAETGRAEGAAPRPALDWRAVIAPLLLQALGPLPEAPPPEPPPIVSSTPAFAAGHLVLACNVPGARVLVDGQLVGETPLARHRLTPGRHVVLVAKAGWTMAEGTVVIVAGYDAPLEARLAPQAMTPTYDPATEPETEWYGYATLLVDGAAIAAGISSENPAFWVTGYLVGPPIVHLVHGSGGGAAGSFGLRLGAPLLGGLLLFPLGGGYGAALGLALGVLVAILVDSAAIAHREIEPGAGALRLAPMFAFDGKRTLLGARGSF